MKVLDLGAHDGYVTAYAKRHWPDADRELEVDGVELHPHGVEVCRERGINCVQGAAEDAPALLEAGSYDAVVMYELIEHVPDVDKLLDAAEAMLKPKGRVYLSTPDGTFGQGQNPHHLRVLRMIDLTDLGRRRGHLHDAEVGRDGIGTISYEPAPRKGELAINCGPGWESWAPMDIEHKGLGGSETAAVRLAEALCELGWIVTVYGEISDECVFKDALFRHWTTFDPTIPRDVVISSRLPETFSRRVNAQTKMLWVHDVDCGDRLTPELAAELDHVLVLSGWHERHVAGQYPFLGSKIHKIRNGIHRPYFKGLPDEPEPRVLYTSSPDRGLDFLLEWWPEIRARVPDAELAYCYPAVYDAVADQVPQIAEYRERVAKLADQPGVTSLGSLTQPALAALMRESRVWAHPSFSTPGDEPFHETSCIGAMEAQAAGLHVVASDWGALRETVVIGELVSAEPKSEKWKRGFVEGIVKGLTDERTQTHAALQGRRVGARWGWEGVAQALDRLVAPRVR